MTKNSTAHEYEALWIESQTSCSPLHAISHINKTETKRKEEKRSRGEIGKEGQEEIK